MPEEDIYGSKKRYEKFMLNIDDLTKLTSKVAKYYCKNKVNLQYFRQFGKIFDSRDTSYIRRLRLLGTLRMLSFATTKDLKDCEREDINEIVAFSHTMNKSPKTKSDFIRDIKFMWKQLFPERDERGRIDEMITPYPVRHLSPKIDKSREVRRNDKLTLFEYERIIEYFSDNPQIQAYITLSVESLTRPQELCYTKISDVEINEEYAKIWISSHGKEGVKFLQCIDSFPYFIKWYSKHPFKGDKDAYLFFSNGSKDRPITPDNMNKKLKLACKKLNIDKKITPYSLKRNGVTFSRLRGDSDVDIQHRAGWTSTKQLQTYDMSGAEDTFKRELAKRGMIDKKEFEDLSPSTKTCICGKTIGFSEKICIHCNRLTDREVIKSNRAAEKEIMEVFSYAVKHPEKSFIDIMDEFRKT